jgi:hypothetical protein
MRKSLKARTTNGTTNARSDHPELVPEMSTDTRPGPSGEVDGVRLYAAPLEAATMRILQAISWLLVDSSANRKLRHPRPSTGRNSPIISSRTSTRARPQVGGGPETKADSSQASRSTDRSRSVGSAGLARARRYAGIRGSFASLSAPSANALAYRASKLTSTALGQRSAGLW